MHMKESHELNDKVYIHLRKQLIFWFCRWWSRFKYHENNVMENFLSEIQTDVLGIWLQELLPLIDMKTGCEGQTICLCLITNCRYDIRCCSDMWLRNICLCLITYDFIQICDSLLATWFSFRYVPIWTVAVKLLPM